MYTCVDVSDQVILEDGHAVIHIGTRLPVGEPAQKMSIIAMRLMIFLKLACYTMLYFKSCCMEVSWQTLVSQLQSGVFLEGHSQAMRL